MDRHINSKILPIWWKRWEEEMGSHERAQNFQNKKKGFLPWSLENSYRYLSHLKQTSRKSTWIDKNIYCTLHLYHLKLLPKKRKGNWILNGALFKLFKLCAFFELAQGALFVPSKVSTPSKVKIVSYKKGWNCLIKKLENKIYKKYRDYDLWRSVIKICFNYT